MNKPLWLGWWVFRLGASSRMGIAYNSSRPTEGVRLCAHLHRTEARAILCGEEMARKLNESVA